MADARKGRVPKRRLKGAVPPPIDAAATGTKFRPVLAAAALAEALVRPDVAVAEDYGVTARTIAAWRQRLRVGETAEDTQLREAFASARAALMGDLTRDLGETLAAARSYIRRSATVEVVNPEMLDSVTNAAKTLHEMHIADRMLDAWIAQFDRQHGTGAESQPAAAAPDSSGG